VASCELVGKRYLVLPVEHPLFDESLRMLLTAMATRAVVEVRLDPGAEACAISSVTVFSRHVRR